MVVYTSLATVVEMINRAATHGFRLKFAASEE